jgi:hypothetical protein
MRALKSISWVRKASILPGLVRAACVYRHPSPRQEVAGITTESPLGLAAGCDKNGVAAAFFGSFGFGQTDPGCAVAGVTEETGD